MCVCVYIGELCEIVGFSEQLFSLSLPSHLRVSILTLVSLLSSSSTHVHTEKWEKEEVAKKMAAGLHINREQSRVESSLQEDLEICSPICSPNPTANIICCLVSHSITQKELIEWLLCAKQRAQLWR